MPKYTVSAAQPLVLVLKDTALLLPARWDGMILMLLPCSEIETTSSLPISFCIVFWMLLDYLPGIFAQHPILFFSSFCLGGPHLHYDRNLYYCSGKLYYINFSSRLIFSLVLKLTNIFQHWIPWRLEIEELVWILGLGSVRACRNG